MTIGPLALPGAVEHGQRLGEPRAGGQAPQRGQGVRRATSRNRPEGGEELSSQSSWGNGSRRLTDYQAGRTQEQAGRLEKQPPQSSVPQRDGAHAVRAGPGCLRQAPRSVCRVKAQARVQNLLPDSKDLPSCGCPGAPSEAALDICTRPSQARQLCRQLRGHGLAWPRRSPSGRQSRRLQEAWPPHSGRKS